MNFDRSTLGNTATQISGNGGNHFTTVAVFAFFSLISVYYSCRLKVMSQIENENLDQKVMSQIENDVLDQKVMSQIEN